MAYDSGNFKGPGGVNVSEILRVADLVERSATFTMSCAYEDCGSPGCIVGHIMGPKAAVGKDPDGRDWDDFSVASARVLGISEDQAESLFRPERDRDGFDFFGDHLSPQHTAACLRKLAETGEVDWLGTKPSGAK